MRGKVCVVTGATSGIGLETAKELGAMGARIVLVGRDPKRGQMVLSQLAHMGVKAGIHYADLSLLAETKRLAQEIVAAEPRIDVLVNCAGAAFHPRQVTAEGFERTFALNHLCYFVLANLLLGPLRAAAPSRIVNVASDAHRRARLDFSDLQFERGYSAVMAYSRSKLANILFTRELARRLVGTGVTANAVHPGFVRTRIGDNVGGIRSAIFAFLKFAAARSVKKGAEGVVFLAAAPEVSSVTGAYFFDGRPHRPTRAAQDDAAARRLWAESARLTGVG
ncbi:MAG: SDR family oxidoreductase [Alphaproteobacteria bacterium]